MTDTHHRGARIALLMLLLLPFAAPARADVAGSADPAFAAARATWLADDDAAALPALASLAAGGSRAAQVLLALIDQMPEAQGPWLVALPRAERIALLRRPGGLSGGSWMQAAAADTPLAAAWVALEDAGNADELATARAFAALDERRAVRVAVLTRAARQRHGFATLADDPAYPPALRYLVWREWSDDPTAAPRLAAELAARLPGDPQLGFHDARPIGDPERDAWLATDPLAAPLRAFCAATCPAGPTPCARAAYELVGRHRGLATLGSPAETLIPTAAWIASPRGRVALLRVPEARDPAEGWRLRARLAAVDACLGAALAAETARFGL